MTRYADQTFRHCASIQIAKRDIDVSQKCVSFRLMCIDGRFISIPVNLVQSSGTDSCDGYFEIMDKNLLSLENWGCGI